MAGPFDVETPTADVRCLGANYYGGSYWVTGTNDPFGPKIYEFDLNGVLLNTNLQTTTSPFWGHRDMADGENLGRTELYAGNETGELNVYDMSSGSPVWLTSIPVATSSTIRALAVDPNSGHFLSGDFSSPILEFDSSGTIVNSYPNPASDVYGAAWDTTNDTLWLHGQDDNGFGNSNHFHEYDLSGGSLSFTGREFWGSNSPAGIAGGADFYADSRNPDSDTLLGLSQASPDEISAYNAVGTTPPPPPVSWIVNLPGTFVSIPAAGAVEGFEAYGGSVPAHMAVSELDAATGLADPEAWCNIGQRGPTTGGRSGNPPFAGSYALEMGLDPSSSNYHDVRNALVLGIDAGGKVLELDFQAYEHGEETDPIDGVWVSENGSDWWEVWSTWNSLLASQWNAIAAVDLSSTPADTSQSFYLMIAQEDNFPLGYLDGVQVDEIGFTVTGTVGPVLAVTNLVAGQVATATVTQATPGGLVYFAYSLAGGGPTAVPVGPCGTVVADLSPPVLALPPVFADPSGTADVQALAPAGTAGRSVWLQAFDLPACAPSNGLAEVIG